jgi:hypothetical protein
LFSPCIPSLILCITCPVPALYPLLSCIPCLGSALQYILCACSVHSFPVCITSTSILASLRCTCFVIARQILSTLLSTFRANPNRPRRTLRPTDRNNISHLVKTRSPHSGLLQSPSCLLHFLGCSSQLLLFFLLSVSSLVSSLLFSSSTTCLYWWKCFYAFSLTEGT